VKEPIGPIGIIDWVIKLSYDLSYDLIVLSLREVSRIKHTSLLINIILSPLHLLLRFNQNVCDVQLILVS
jgi:hypothetical protein